MRRSPTHSSVLPGLSAPAPSDRDEVLPVSSRHRSAADPYGRPAAVVLDLFGTLVAAPSRAERRAAAVRFAELLHVPASAAESMLSDTWRVRHDGQLKSATAVAAHLAARCGASAVSADQLRSLLAGLADRRLRADATLLRALAQLRDGGVRLAVLSDASPDIAEAWSRSDLASYFDSAVFSCRVGAVKPHPLLFRTVLRELGVPPHRAVYCGDGGGDELAGAERAGMRAVRSERRGGLSGLVFGETAWSGVVVSDVEALPSLLNGVGKR